MQRNRPGCTYISIGYGNKHSTASTKRARMTKNGRFAVSRTRENTLVAPKNDDNGRRSWRKRATSFSQTTRLRYRTDYVIGAVPRPGALAEKNENWRIFPRFGNLQKVKRRKILGGRHCRTQPPGTGSDGDFGDIRGQTTITATESGA